MAGVIVTTRQEDFDKITEEKVASIIKEVGITVEEAEKITFGGDSGHNRHLLAAGVFLHAGWRGGRLPCRAEQCLFYMCFY